MNVVSMLPWWACVVLAVGSYFVFHRLAVPGPLAPMQPGQASGLIVRAWIQGLAGAGQHAAPIVCLGAAFMSFWRRRQRETLVADVGQASAASALDAMSWREFEMLVGEAFRLQGYRVSETGGGGADGGVDLVLFKGTEKSLVQCKQWKAMRVGVDVVRQLYGVMAAKGAAAGFVVSSGRFTEDARAFADGRNVTLVDGQTLFGLIAQARKSLVSATVTNGPPEASPPTERPCPVCASAMVRRISRKGVNAGSEFWGCSRYPGCRGTRPAG